ncbi:roadblock/LC7 domain-containing protein [Streptomyces sp. NPDC005908]|uniref:roadblock/LC7 domain-containing protein n=1 Tax=unclassified Streptomyces TaxID=2593676 RepID=UPI0011A3F653|nr:roadblock/LC7 domain-containing protein [Streptomyces sp. T12]TWD21629.1 putative regulator of Ras-like GTPase activity (Roadblock/LC7/MglB family) [Streptomyces sp. T12]
MTAPSTFGLSSEARNLHWLLTNLVEEVPGILSVAVVSSDGLLLLSSDETLARARSGPGGGTAPVRGERGAARPGPRGSSADLATVVSGIGSLTIGASKLMDYGPVKHTMVAMDEGSLFVMSISDGSLLGVHGSADCDMSVVAYHMALFVGRAGHVLTPELRSELRKNLENAESAGSTEHESAGSPR